MEVTIPVASKDGSKLSPGANVRKMKQSRLPFQFLSTPPKPPVVEPSEATRKRKPSSETLDVEHVAKAGRVSGVKEHVTTLILEEENRKPAGDNVDNTSANEDDKPSGSATNKRSLSAKKGKKKSKSNDRPKILIKFPIGKRKRNSTDKSKTVKKKAAGGAKLNFSSNPDESIILDDSNLSDDGTTAEAGKFSSTSSRVNKKAQSKDEQEYETKDSKDQDSGSVEESKEQVEDSNAENKADTSLEHLDKEQCNTTEDVFPTESVVELENNKPPFQSVSTPVIDVPSDVDSSEDIYLLCTPNSKILPNEDEKKVRKLTPKQIAQRKNHEKRRALKEQEKQEKRRQQQEEREEKAREKEEQERLRRKEREEKEDQKRREREEKELMKRKDREEKEEQKRKEREEKEEQKRKEREEKEKKRQAEIDQKNEEKRLKEEERRKKEEQREEEKKRKEEEKEAEEKRKQKVAQAFTSFFVKKPINGGGVKASDDENSVESSPGGIPATGTCLDQQRFMPFCVKGDMRLAPTVRRVLNSGQKDALERILSSADGEQVTDRADLYVELLRRKSHNPIKTERTWNAEDEEENDEIMIVDENVCHEIEVDPGKMKQKFKTKFFLFEENRRPPYRGTWRKRSACIKARRPFVQDTKFFDYEVDSDDEWEEEEPGESLHGSDDEKDVDPEEDYEVDNEFFVPHGHLSDEELHAEEEGADDDNSPETQKVKLKIMQQEFVAEMKKKTEKIKPRLIGCIWEREREDTNRYTECSALIRKMLDDRAMLFNPDEPISFTRSFSRVNGFIEQDADSVSPSKDNEKPTVKKVRITDDAIRDLARLVHGNINNRKFLVREFHAFCTSRNDSVEFSFESIKNKIKEIAQWGPCSVEGPMQGKLCWIVDEKVLQQWDLADATIPNEWKYHLQKRKSTKQEKKTNLKKETNPLSDARDTGMKLTNTLPDTSKQTVEKCVADTVEQEKTNPSMVQDNVDSGKGSNAVAAISKGPTVTKPKKRVPLLMSIPRGQNINQTTKNSLISQFLSRENSAKTKPVIPEAKHIDNAVIEID